MCLSSGGVDEPEYYPSGNHRRLADLQKLGHRRAAVILRTRHARDKASTRGKALAELGKIATTIHIPRYIDAKAVRRAHPVDWTDLVSTHDTDIKSLSSTMPVSRDE